MTNNHLIILNVYRGRTPLPPLPQATGWALLQHLAFRNTGGPSLAQAVGGGHEGPAAAAAPEGVAHVEVTAVAVADAVVDAVEPACMASTEVLLAGAGSSALLSETTLSAKGSVTLGTFEKADGSQALLKHAEGVDGDTLATSGGWKGRGGTWHGPLDLPVAGCVGLLRTRTERMSHVCSSVACLFTLRVDVCVFAISVVVVQALHDEASLRHLIFKTGTVADLLMQPLLPGAPDPYLWLAAHGGRAAWRARSDWRARMRG